MLLGHRHLPAVAVIEGIRRALQAGSVNPEVVLVEARQAADSDTAQVVPIGIGSQTLARYDRPTPALGSYDVLLASDHLSPRLHGHEAAGQVAAPAEVGG